KLSIETLPARNSPAENSPAGNSPAVNSHNDSHVMNSMNNNHIHRTKSIIWGEDFIFGSKDVFLLANMPSRPNSGIWTPNPEKRGQL
ncbi:30585_t:CDS:2, partial [Racocetra persica]